MYNLFSSKLFINRYIQNSHCICLIFDDVLLISLDNVGNIFILLSDLHKFLTKYSSYYNVHRNENLARFSRPSLPVEQLRYDAAERPLSWAGAKLRQNCLKCTRFTICENSANANSFFLHTLCHKSSMYYSCLHIHTFIHIKVPKDSQKRLLPYCIYVKIHTLGSAMNNNETTL